MQTFLILLIVVGVLAGVVVLIILGVHSRAAKKSIGKAFEALGLEWGSSDSWVSREWKDTHFTSSIKDVTGSLEAFAGKIPETALEEKLGKFSRKTQAVLKGQLSAGGIDWLYAIATIKVEGGSLVRSLWAATGDGQWGLLFSCNMSVGGDLNRVPDDMVRSILTFIKKR